MQKIFPNSIIRGTAAILATGLAHAVAFGQPAPSQTEDDGANPAFARAMTQNSGTERSSSVPETMPHLRAFDQQELRSIAIGREYHDCLIATATRIGQGNREPADIVVRAASSRCQTSHSDGSNLLFLLRTAIETESLQLEIAAVQDGARGRSSGVVLANAARQYENLLARWNDEAIAAILEERVR